MFEVEFNSFTNSRLKERLIVECRKKLNKTFEFNIETSDETLYRKALL